MITEEKIRRINALARKKKEEGLTGEELEEQQLLRGEYLAAIRANLKSQLDNIRITEEEEIKEEIDITVEMDGIKRE